MIFAACEFLELIVSFLLTAAIVGLMLEWASKIIAFFDTRRKVDRYQRREELREELRGRHINQAYQRAEDFDW